jgi:hypothetical protein
MSRLEPAVSSGFGRADARIRTADPFITSEVLYQLSYVGGALRLAVFPTTQGGVESVSTIKVQPMVAPCANIMCNQWLHVNEEARDGSGTD